MTKIPVKEYNASKKPQAKNKYGAKKVEYRGVMYDSTKEANYAKKLDLLYVAGEIISVQRQIPIPLIVNGKKICTYKCDFLVVWKSGLVEYIDVKGVRTKDYIIKAKLVKALLGVTIKEV